MRIGRRSDNFARDSTRAPKVAENSSVCRRPVPDPTWSTRRSLPPGSAFKTSASSSSKPSSRRRSASSRMQTSMSSKCTECALEMWSTSRPGVATMMSGRSRSRASWRLTSFSPPTMRTVVISGANFESCLIICSHCAASSRVGRMMTHRVAARESPRRSCRIFSKVGSANAAVLPEPVAADAQMSRPAKASGMHRSCTGVGCEKPKAANARRRGLESCNSSKVRAPPCSVMTSSKTPAAMAASSAASCCARAMPTLALRRSRPAASSLTPNGLTESLDGAGAGRLASGSLEAFFTADRTPEPSSKANSKALNDGSESSTSSGSTSSSDRSVSSTRIVRG
mmetsp:Transcript_19152/g.64688  ORF Transcript_19152/g.64688 Transcript_19152/m.64688 type:complete len:340 (-) Transcript_19152:3-1022(-)